MVWGLNDGRIAVQFASGTGYVSLHGVEMGFGAHPASCFIDTGDSPRK